MRSVGYVALAFIRRKGEDYKSALIASPMFGWFELENYMVGDDEVVKRHERMVF